MSLAVCVHGRTVHTDEPGPSCDDCEELAQLRRLERLLRLDSDCSCPRRADGLHVVDIDSSCPTHGLDPYSVTRVLGRLDAIRSRRGPGSLGACTCSPCPMAGAPAYVRCEHPRHQPEDGRHHDPACPQHGTDTCTCRLVGSGSRRRAAVDTTMRAREGRVCAAQSLAPGLLGVYCYCTRERGHDGQHVAQASTGEEVGRWST